MKKSLLLVFSILAILSCNDDDGGKDSALEGKWNLVKISTLKILTSPKGL